VAHSINDPVSSNDDLAEGFSHTLSYGRNEFQFVSNILK